MATFVNNNNYLLTIPTLLLTSGGSLRYSVIESTKFFPRIVVAAAVMSLLESNCWLVLQSLCKRSLMSGWWFFDAFEVYFWHSLIADCTSSFVLFNSPATSNALRHSFDNWESSLRRDLISGWVVFSPTNFYISSLPFFATQHVWITPIPGIVVFGSSGFNDFREVAVSTPEWSDSATRDLSTVWTFSKSSKMLISGKGRDLHKHIFKLYIQHTCRLWWTLLGVLVSWITDFNSKRHTIILMNRPTSGALSTIKQLTLDCESICMSGNTRK